MSTFVQDFEEDDEQNSRIIQLLNGCPNTSEKGDDSSIDRTTVTSKKKRNLPGNPDPDAEIVALSPRTLMATNRYICEVCHKGFQRDQNLQLHRRGHNLPWKLKQRAVNVQVKKRVYICPEPNCVHHEPTRALGDLTGIKKHFCRKHGEKKWKCDKCSKRYAVQSDWKAHAKICGTREYRCDCGTIFSRKDSFITHRAFCDALTEENYKMNLKVDATVQELSGSCTNTNMIMGSSLFSHNRNHDKSLSYMSNDFDPVLNQTTMRPCFTSSVVDESPMAAYTSATALLQKAAEMSAKISDKTITPILLKGFNGYSASSFSMNGEQGYSIGTNTSDPSGLYDSSLVMHSSKINSKNHFERQVFNGVNERTTVDFLGMDYTNEHPGLHHQQTYC
ncbi:protein indeterminate-domain 12-like [Rutidosis leptorrhynchoides]|uniref:protein indeterminate-domain 12-like n=1 Tax=Rutidosis leptorrhynchoides TaxID=125765 RepID=UPI003A99F7B0